MLPRRTRGTITNVILPSADIDGAVQRGVKFLMWNSGQGCSLPSRMIGLHLTAGQMILNGADLHQAAPFGGFKQPGSGREWGPYAFEAFLEPKALVGYEAA